MINTIKRLFKMSVIAISIIASIFLISYLIYTGQHVGV